MVVVAEKVFRTINWHNIFFMTRSNKEHALAFLRLVARGKIAEAYDQYIGENFRHHHASMKGDAASLQREMEESEKKFPGKVFEERRVLEDGNMVAVHSRLRLAPEMPEIAAVHIFRFESGRIAELWDVAQEVPPDSPNEHGAF